MVNNEDGPPAHHGDAPPPDSPDGIAQPQQEARDIALFVPPAPMSTQNEGGAAVLAARAEAEIKARALIAINRPRSFERFRKNILEACGRARFADAAIYSKPTGGKAIEGLSIRFAEECAKQYGNLDISSMVVGENDEYRTIECAVADLETNMVWRQNVVVPKTVERKKTQAGDEVIRRRTNSQGQPVYIVRATADQTFMQQNALISKTVRNLILNLIPSDVKEEAYEMMETVLSGEIRKNPAAYREKLRRAFFKIKIVEAQLAEYLGKPLDEANEAELFVLARIGEGIAQGESSWADVMAQKRGPVQPTTAEVAQSDSAGAGATAALKSRLGATAPDSAADRLAARIAAIRAKPATQRTDDEAEDLRQFEADNGVTS